MRLLNAFVVTLIVLVMTVVGVAADGSFTADTFMVTVDYDRGFLEVLIQTDVSVPDDDLPFYFSTDSIVTTQYTIDSVAYTSYLNWSVYHNPGDTGNQYQEIILFQFDTTQRLDVMLELLDSLDFRPINLLELLVLAEVYPQQGSQYPIYALGSYMHTWSCGRLYSPVLRSAGEHRQIIWFSSDPDLSIDTSYRLAAVRK